MGATATRHSATVLDHVETIIAIELLCAAQGIDFRQKEMGGIGRLGQGTQIAYALVREKVPFLQKDVNLSIHIESVRQLIADATIKLEVEQALGMP